MKFTLDWLKDHLRTQASLDAIIAVLPQIGLEVEAVSEPLNLEGLELARIIDVRPHPQADRLSLCRIETKAGIYDGQIVCGAPNLRIGQISVLARPDAIIPATGKKLRASKIRGETSAGMLCSAAELNISDDAQGILDLDEALSLNMDVAAALGMDDIVIDVEITPNRPDWAGVRGIARDLAAAGLGDLIKADEIKMPENFASPIKIKRDFSSAESSACPIFAGMYVRGIKNRPSPGWMQKRLSAAGLRPISALVDITNYISHDSARPLHVYDAEKLAKAPDHDIHLRMARQGEKFLALDGREYELNPAICVIADSQKALALGGVIGGQSSAVSDMTTEIFIESALFDPIRTSRTGRALGIESEARYRFERGVDPASVLSGCHRAAKMIIDICGGETSAAVISGRPDEDERIIHFTPAQVEKLTGIEISAEATGQILKKLGFRINQDGAVWQAYPPSWRRDIGRTDNKAGLADLAEEILRIHGVDHIPETALAVSAPALSPANRSSLPPKKRHLRHARAAMAANGLVEAITWSFLPKKIARLFMSEKQCAGLHLANPISEDKAIMRGNLLAGLLMALAHNLARGQRHISLFEAGIIFETAEPGAQKQHLAALREGRAGLAKTGRDWRGDAPEADLYAAKTDMMTALAACGINMARLTITPDAPDYFHPGRSGSVMLGAQHLLGFFGQIHPLILSALDIDAPAAGFEINMDSVPVKKNDHKNDKAQKSHFNPSALQPVRRDFAFIVASSVLADDLIQAARAALTGWQADIHLFDLFEDDSGAAFLEQGHKSLAFEVSLYPRANLRDDDIDAISQKIIASVEAKTGGRIRQ